MVIIMMATIPCCFAYHAILTLFFEKEPEAPEPELEPTTEVIFLCIYKGCRKTFIDAILDSSKLKRHFLIHTGDRDFVYPYEGNGKAFSLDFNLRSHMKMYSQENYHIFPYPDCGKRYAHEYKLKNHITTHHEKSATMEVVKYTPASTSEKQTKTPKPTSGGEYGSASSDRPYACPYEGCEKAYIHAYKLKLFNHCLRNLLLLVQLMPRCKPKTKCK
ncbi:hypothetical protein UlMin_000159 [Ulmus minor]